MFLPERRNHTENSVLCHYNSRALIMMRGNEGRTEIHKERVNSVYNGSYSKFVVHTVDTPCKGLSFRLFVCLAKRE